MILCIRGLFETLSINDTQHINALSLCWVSLCWVSRFIDCYAEHHVAEWKYTLFHCQQYNQGSTYSKAFLTDRQIRPGVVISIFHWLFKVHLRADGQDPGQHLVPALLFLRLLLLHLHLARHPPSHHDLVHPGANVIKLLPSLSLMMRPKKLECLSFNSIFRSV
jgi:hypothetical protein